MIIVLQALPEGKWFSFNYLNESLDLLLINKVKTTNIILSIGMSERALGALRPGMVLPLSLPPSLSASLGSGRLDPGGHLVTGNIRPGGRGTELGIPAKSRTNIVHFGIHRSMGLSGGILSQDCVTKGFRETCIFASASMSIKRSETFHRYSKRKESI
jgi:hypothetical protein